ncbi:autotransporter assembly complex protein TamB [Agarivorans sp. QJM3NY_25]|uniref:autotransporter assembly complex protein TamB n=1 Tax=Agarivorans sp. QJM3NY_25 TaxID=3421430 RepID=UPI003D7CC4DD
MIFKCIKFVVIAVSAVLFSLIIALSFSPSTEWLLVQVSKAVDGLTILQPQGNFYQGIQARQVVWQQPGLTVQLNQLKLGFDWVCISQTQLCIDHLDTSRIRLDLDSEVMAASVSTTEPAPSTSPIWTPPVPFVLQRLNAGDALLNLDGVALSWHQLDLRANWQHQTIELEQLLLEQWAVVLPESQLNTTSIQPNSSPLPDTLTISLPDISPPYQVNVKQLRFSQGRVNDGQNDYLFPELTLAATVGFSSVDIQALHLLSPWGELDLSGRQGFQASFASQLIGSWKMQVEQQPLDIEFSLHGDGTDLVSDIHSRGWLAAELQLQSAWLKPNIPFQLDAKLQQKFPLLSEQLSLASFKLHAEGGLKQYHLQWQSELSGLQDLWLNGKVTGNLSQIDQFSMLGELLDAPPENSSTVAPESTAKPKSLGGFQLQGSASWQAQLQANVSLNIEQLALHHWLALSEEFALPKIDGKLNAQLSEQQWQVSQADFTGLWFELPLSASLTAEGNLKGQTNQGHLDLRLGHSQLLADANLVGDKLRLNSTLDTPQLAELPWLSGGRAGLNLKLKGPLNQPFIDWSLQADDIETKQLGLDSLSSKGQLNLDSGLTGKFGLNLSRLTLAEQVIDNASINYSSDKSHQQLALKLEQVARKLSMLLQGQGDLQQWNGQVSDADIEAELGTWSLSQPIDLTLVEGIATVGAHCWSKRPSQLCLNAPLSSDGNSTLDLSIEQFDFASLKLFMPEGLALEGRASLHLDSSLNRWRPKKGKLKLKFSPGRMLRHQENENLSLAYQQLDLSADLENQRLRWQARLSSEQLGTIRSQGNADLLRDGELAAELRLEDLQLSPLLPFVEALNHLSGQVNGTVSVAGKLKSPKLQGEINLVEGVLSGPDIPLTIEQLQSRLIFNNQTASLNGSFRSDGRDATWQGQFTWPNDKLLGDIDFTADKLLVNVDPYANLVVSPNITVAISDSLIAVGGTVRADEGEIKVKSLPESAVTESSDAIVMEEQSETPTTKHTSLDVTVTLSDSLSLQALGLDTRLQGQLNLKQQPTEPLIANGRIELVDGKFMAYGQNLIIEKGWLMFTGPLDQPYLDFQAIRNPATISDDVTVGVKVVGLADAPQVNLYSDPAMSQNEMLSYLLRGRALGDNEQDSNALSAMLLSAGVNRAGGLVGNVGNTLGVKDLSLATAGSGSATQVEVSAYILPGVQVRYGMGVFDPVNELTVKYELLPKLFIEAFSGLNSALDIYYEFHLE